MRNVDSTVVVLGNMCIKSFLQRVIFVYIEVILECILL